MVGLFFCCKDESATTDAVDAAASNSNKNKAATTSRGGVGVSTDATASPRSNDGDDFDEENDDGSTLFFSARESFSQIVNELPYPPASTKISIGRSRIDQPRSLLLSAPISTIAEVNSEKDEMDIKSSTIVKEKRPTVVLKERLATNNNSNGNNNHHHLKQPHQPGYPGELSEKELEACLELRRRLRENDDPTYRGMVYLNVDVDVNDTNNDKNKDVSGMGPEEEAFALCRFLRARQFNVDDTFEMMDEHIDLFRTCLKEHNLYRSIENYVDHTRCPLELFWYCFPMVPFGVAKNGSFIVYMKAGNIRLEDGFDCINYSPEPKEFVDTFIPMAWWVLCAKFCSVIKQLQTEQEMKSNNENDDDDNDNDAGVVLAEAVIIVDLHGLQRSFFSTRTMEFLKFVFEVIQCFPEILNRVVVVNVPYFFTFIWTVLKHFVDPRTTQKIGFFSTTAAAKKDLLELIDSDQLMKEFGGNHSTATYEDVLMSSMIQDSPYKRFIIERYNTNDHKNDNKKKNAGNKHHHHPLQSFELIENETAKLTVYTQAKIHNVDTTDASEGGDGTTTGTRFLLLSSSSSSTSSTATIPTTNTTTKATTITNKFGQPAATTKENSIVHGPGSFQLVSSIQSQFEHEKEQYLVVVSIS